MSESGQASVGQILRDAREAQGITLEDAAVRLRLMQRQVEAMETDDFESLGQPVFARGFVRNYARLLGLAPEALLARMAGAPAEPARGQPCRTALAAFLVDFALADPAAAGFAGGGGGARGAVSGGSTARERTARASRRRRCANPSRTGGGSCARYGTGAKPLPPPSKLPPLRRPRPQRRRPSRPEAGGSPRCPKPRRLTVCCTSNSATSPGSKSRMPAAACCIASSTRPARSVDIPGQPPFDVVIGNAAQVRMTYNGRPIDLKPFIEVTVARFTLEE